MNSYFELRGLSPAYYANYKVPQWLVHQLSRVDTAASILDFGCGYGQLVRELQTLGYSSVEGADVEPASLAHCLANGLIVHDLRSDSDFFRLNRGRFDLIISLHVLEHIPKRDVIATVTDLRGLLKPEGRMFVAVPNAQAFTGAYWAYEDFTHCTLYTSGSLYYVLKAAGFTDIKFADIDCTAGLNAHRRLVRRLTWRMFAAYYRTMCKLLASPTHAPSPDVFSYEVKAIAQ